jgi:hypothetical protein
VKISRRHGTVTVRLDPLERSLLAGMLDELAAALEPDALADDDPVVARLYPAGYRDDDGAATDFRELTAPALVAERRDRVRECQGELDGAENGRVEFDSAGADRWLRVLNDLRLALGTRLGVVDDEPPEIGPDDSIAPRWAAYYWLTGLQDGLVRALMG